MANGLALIPVCMVFIVFGMDMSMFELEQITVGQAVVSLMLASPFLVIAVGHRYLVRRKTEHLLLLACNPLVLAGWLYATLVMRSLQPGWLGVAAFTLLLLAIAGACVGFALAWGRLWRKKEEGSSRSFS